ncbi:MAG: DMT family transporter [Synergistaceae bacterium]|nr:DMT family transporter [Synergistaceae bacterium]
MGKQIRGMGLLTLTAFIWGTAFVAQSVGTGYISPFTFNAVRFFIGGASLLPVMLIMSILSRGKPDAARAPDADIPHALMKGGLYCGVILFIAAFMQQSGISYTTAGKAGFITALYIIIVPILGISLGRRVPLYMWVCAAAAVAGMYLLCIKESLSLNKGDAYILVCAFLYAGHILVIDRFSPLVDGVKMSCVQFFSCGALSLICSFIFEHPELSAVWDARMPLLYTGVLSSGVAYTLQIVAQKDVNPVIATLIMSLESVFAALAGWVALSETLSLREITGCVVMFAAIIAAQTLGVLKSEPVASAGA